MERLVQGCCRLSAVLRRRLTREIHAARHGVHLIDALTSASG